MFFCAFPHLTISFLKQISSLPFHWNPGISKTLRIREWHFNHGAGSILQNFLQSPLTVVCEVVGSNNWKRGLTRGLKYLYLLTARMVEIVEAPKLVTENTWVKRCPSNPRKLGFFGCGNVTTICRLHHGGSWYDHGCRIPVAPNSPKNISEAAPT